MLIIRYWQRLNASHLSPRRQKLYKKKTKELIMSFRGSSRGSSLQEIRVIRQGCEGQGARESEFEEWGAGGEEAVSEYFH